MPKTAKERIAEVLRKAHSMADDFVGLASGTLPDYEAIEREVDAARSGKTRLTRWDIEGMVRKLRWARNQLQQRITELSEDDAAMQNRDRADSVLRFLEMARTKDLEQIGRDEPGAKRQVKAAQDEVKRLADKVKHARGVLGKPANLAAIVKRLQGHVAKLDLKEQWLNEQAKALALERPREALALARIRTGMAVPPVMAAVPPKFTVHPPLTKT